MPKKLAVLAFAFVNAFQIALTEAHAKIPGSTHCYNDVCHRVRTLTETMASVGVIERVLASYYDHPDVDRYNPSLMTSSGAKFDPASVQTVASPTLPDGTIILVRNPANGHAAIARVTDGGPYFGKRTLDLARGLADALGTRQVGVAELELLVLRAPTQDETTYRADRAYPVLPGPIGVYAALASAQAFTFSAQLLPPASAIYIVTSVVQTKPSPELVSPKQQREPLQHADAKATLPHSKARQPKASVSESAMFVASFLNRADVLQ